MSKTDGRWFRWGLAMRFADRCWAEARKADIPQQGWCVGRAIAHETRAREAVRDKR